MNYLVVNNQLFKPSYLIINTKKAKLFIKFLQIIFTGTGSAKNPINQIHQQEIVISSSSIDAKMSNQVDT